MKRAILSILLLVVPVLSQRSGGGREVLLGAEFNLKIGQKAHIKSEGLTVGFISVTEDSRCPQGVTCMWAGNAVVAVGLSKANGDTASFELNTDVDPKERSYRRYVIRLVALNPYPKEDSPVKKEDHVATFVIRKSSN